MANDLTTIMPKVLSAGLLAFRNRAVFPRLVNQNWSSEEASAGQTIDVPLPRALTPAAVVPANVPPAGTNITTLTTPIRLDQWRMADFHLSDKDQKEIDANRTFIPGEVTEAAEALATEANGYLANLTSRFAMATAAPAGEPWAAAHADATAAALVAAFGQNKVAIGNRRNLVDPINEGLAVTLPEFRDASQSASAQTIIEANIGRKYGFDWFMDQQCKRGMTKGGGTGHVADGAQPAGSLVLAVKTGTGSFLAGDSIKVTGSEFVNYYTVAAGSTTTAINIDGRGLLNPVADGDTVEIVTPATWIPAFHRDAIAFVNRPIADSNESLGNRILTQTDPVSGITMRLEVSRQHKRNAWQFDILYGGGVIAPEWGCKVGIS
jgi:hypothetical protein